MQFKLLSIPTINEWPHIAHNHQTCLVTASAYRNRSWVYDILFNILWAYSFVVEVIKNNNVDT